MNTPPPVVTEAQAFVWLAIALAGVGILVRAFGRGRKKTVSLALAPERALVDGWAHGWAHRPIAEAPSAASKGAKVTAGIFLLGSLGFLGAALRTLLSSENPVLAFMMLVITTALGLGCLGAPVGIILALARSGHRLSGLIESFLSFSRMERGRHVFEFEPVSVAELVDRAIASAGERLRVSVSRLDVVVQPELPPVRADREALVTVLLNLLDNAIKYSGADKRVAVRAYTREGLVCLEVEDNGIGFHKRVARRIFERFFQVDRDRAGSIAGVGLGLSIVKHVVDAHGGKIQVASQPGKGSRFTICLPASGA